MVEALERLDRVALEMENTWGADVLPLLVPPDLSEKFAAQKQRLDEMIDGDDSAALAATCEAMIRAWMALDGAARAAGHRPREEAVWVGHHPSYGFCCVYSGNASIAHLPQDMPRFHIDELLKFLPEVVWKAKTLFQGSTVKALHLRPTDLNDEIPF